jgi:Xaa-Pro aminopeptidase
MDAKGEYLIVPGRTASREAFDGAIDRDELARTSGITRIYDEQEGWEKLAVLVRRSKQMGVMEAAAAYIDVYGMYTNPARKRLARRLLKIKPGLLLEDLRPTVAQMRMLKQPPELAAIRQAIEVTANGLQVVTLPTNLRHYKHEYEIEADLSRAFRRTGASGHAFAPIVASGKRGCTLHNVSNDGAIKKGDLIVIDVGAEVDHYAADITRTVIAGEPSARQQQVFDAVHDVQRYALGLLKPGVLLKEYEHQVQEYLGGKLVELGLIPQPDAAELRDYFPHATSHFMGLDVHDAADYSIPLAAGMVLTCEPGIYIKEEGIGVRIEDDVLITEDGNEVLSRAIPARLVGM